MRLGSYVERLQYTISAHKNIHQSTVKSESDIRDADIAEEIGEGMFHAAFNRFIGTDEEDVGAYVPVHTGMNPPFEHKDDE